MFGALLGVILGIVGGIWASLLDRLFFANLDRIYLYIIFGAMTGILSLVLLAFWITVQALEKLNKEQRQGTDNEGVTNETRKSELHTKVNLHYSFLSFFTLQVSYPFSSYRGRAL